MMDMIVIGVNKTYPVLSKNTGVISRKWEELKEIKPTKAV